MSTFPAVLILFEVFNNSLSNQIKIPCLIFTQFCLNEPSFEIFMILNDYVLEKKKLKKKFTLEFQQDCQWRVWGADWHT